MGEAPNPRESSPAHPTVGRPGWTPAHDEHTPEAVAWRAEMARIEAREAMAEAKIARRENAETRTAVEKLDTTLQHLDATIKSSDADWTKRTKTLSRLVWLVVGAALTSLGGAIGLAAWRWLTGPR